MYINKNTQTKVCKGMKSAALIISKVAVHPLEWQHRG